MGLLQGPHLYEGAYFWDVLPPSNFILKGIANPKARAERARQRRRFEYFLPMAQHLGPRNGQKRVFSLLQYRISSWSLLVTPGH